MRTVKQIVCYGPDAYEYRERPVARTREDSRDKRAIEFAEKHLILSLARASKRYSPVFAKYAEIVDDAEMMHLTLLSPDGSIGSGPVDPIAAARAFPEYRTAIERVANIETDRPVLRYLVKSGGMMIVDYCLIDGQ